MTIFNNIKNLAVEKQIQMEKNCVGKIIMMVIMILDDRDKERDGERGKRRGQIGKCWWINIKSFYCLCVCVCLCCCCCCCWMKKQSQCRGFFLYYFFPLYLRKLRIDVYTSMAIGRLVMC